MANSAFSHGTCVESSSFQRAATADARSGAPSIKRYLGELMADAASKIAIALARAHGKLVLHERCGNDVSAVTIDELVVAVLDILGKVVQSQLH